MSDIRQQIGRTFWAAYNDSKFGGRTVFTSIEHGLDAALAVAEPIISKRVIEELAQKAESLRIEVTFNSTEPTLADWIRAQGGEQW